jgi:hypothetical protein
MLQILLQYTNSVEKRSTEALIRQKEFMFNDRMPREQFSIVKQITLVNILLMFI